MTQTTNSIDYNDSVKTSILNVARDLFAKYGYKKTTMEDIAQALGKGKSSLYYYFKNKEEIFQAVIDWEETVLLSRLKSTVNSDASPQDKMKKYVEVRMQTIRELENYHKALRDDVPGGFDFLDHIKGNSEKVEVEMIEQIMIEGQQTELFQVKNPRMAAMAISMALKGLEVPLFRSMQQDDLDEFNIQINNVLNILFYGLIKRD